MTELKPMPQYVRKADVAKRLGVSQKTIDRWVKQKLLNITPVRIAGLTLFSTHELDAQIEAFAKAVPNE